MPLSDEHNQRCRHDDKNGPVTRLVGWRLTLPVAAAIVLPLWLPREGLSGWLFGMSLLGLTGVLLVSVVVAYRSARSGRPVIAAYGLVVAIMLGTGVGVLAAKNTQLQRLPDSCARSVVELTGRVIDFPRERRGLSGDVLSFTLRPDRSAHTLGCVRSGLLRPGLIRVASAQPPQPVQLGDRLRLRLRLRPMPSQWNPGVIPDQAAYAARGLVSRGWAISLQHLVPFEPGPLTAVRRIVVEQLEHADVTGRIRGVLMALVMGRGDDIHRDDWQRFQRLGLSHVLVISGLHIGLVFALTWWLVGRIYVCLPVAAQPHLRAVQSLLAGLIAWLYALLAGFSLPTQRALIMLLCVLLTRWLGWRSGGRHALALALMCVLLIDPLAPLTRGVWLSVGATAVLLAGLRLGRALRRSGALTSLVLLQVWLLLAMAPLTLFWFDRISLLAVPANVVITPIIGFVVVPMALLGVLWTALSSTVLPIEANPFWSIAAGILTVLLPLMDRLDQNWAAAAQLPAVLSVERLTAPTEGATLTVIDVGQGLSVLWREGSSSLLYDTGDGLPDGVSEAERQIMPFLRARGVSALQTLVVSHADRDHSAGIIPLKQHLHVEQHLGYGGETCRVGMQLAWPGEARMTVLNGTLADGVGHASDNPASCVLLIDYRGQRFLLTGDIDRRRERALVRYWREQLRASVLVVAHHGSHSSSSETFLKWVKPEWAVISAGRHNRFGHPAAEVVARFSRRATRILNTGEQGAIEFYVSDQGVVQVSTMRDGTIPYWLDVP